MVDTLTQVSFRQISDMQVMRDTLKSYIVSIIQIMPIGTLNANHIAVVNTNDSTIKKKSEEKDTVERMASALVKSAGN